MFSKEGGFIPNLCVEFDWSREASDMQHDLKRLSNKRAPGTFMIHEPSTSIRSSGERMRRRYCVFLIHAEGTSRHHGLYATGTKLAVERVHTPPGIRRYSRNRLYITVYGMLGILRCLVSVHQCFEALWRKILSSALF